MQNKADEPAFGFGSGLISGIATVLFGIVICEQIATPARSGNILKCAEVEIVETGDSLHRKQDTIVTIPFNAYAKFPSEVNEMIKCGFLKVTKRTSPKP